MSKMFLLLAAFVVFPVVAGSASSLDEIPFPNSAAEANELFKSGSLPEAKSFKNRMVYEGKLYHLPSHLRGIQSYFLALVGSRGEAGPVQTWIPRVVEANEEKRDFYISIHSYFTLYFPTSENEFVTIPRPKSISQLRYSYSFRIIKNKKGDDRIFELTKCALEDGCQYTMSWYEWVCNTGLFGSTGPARKVYRSAPRVAAYGETLGWAIFPVESGEEAASIAPDKPKPKPKPPQG